MHFFTILKTFIFLNTYKNTTRNVKLGNLYISFLMTFMLLSNILAFLTIVPIFYIFTIVLTTLYLFLFCKLARRVLYVYVPFIYMKIPNFCVYKYVGCMISILVFMCTSSMFLYSYLYSSLLHQLLVTFFVFFILALLWFIVLKRTIRQFISYLAILIVFTTLFCIFRSASLFIVINLQGFFGFTLLHIILLGFACYFFLLGVLLVSFPNVCIKIVVYQYQNILDADLIKRLVFFLGLLFAISFRMFILTLLCNIHYTDLTIFLFVSFVPFRAFLTDFFIFVNKALFFINPQKEHVLVLSNVDSQVSPVKSLPYSEISVKRNLILYMKGPQTGGIGSMVGKSIPPTSFSSNRTNVTWPSQQPLFFQQSKRTFVGYFPFFILGGTGDRSAPVRHYFYMPGDKFKPGYAMSLSHSKNEGPSISKNTDVNGDSLEQFASKYKYPIDSQDGKLVKQVLNSIQYEIDNQQALDDAYNKAIKKLTPYTKASGGGKSK